MTLFREPGVLGLGASVAPNFPPILPDGVHKGGVPVDIFIAPGLSPKLKSLQVFL